MNAFKSILAAATFTALFGASVQAADLSADKGEKIDLGTVQGVAYYTVEKEGYRVVATLASSNKEAFRFVAMLKPGQTVTLSTPTSVNAVPKQVEISRNGNRVDVRANALTN